MHVYYQRMYKVNVNTSYYDTNLKLSKDLKETKSTNKAKFALSQQQKQFIELRLPRGYRFALVGDVEQKRNRAPRKAGAEFETQFTKKEEKKELGNSEKRSQKKEDKRGKDQVDSNSSRMIEQSHRQVRHQKGHRIKLDKKQSMEAREPIQDIEMVQEVKKPIETPKKQKMVISQPLNIKGKLSLIQAKDSTKHQPQQFQQQLPQKVKLQPQPHSQQKLLQFPNSMSPERRQFCLRLVSKLKAHKSSWPFRQPVDPINQGVPNYLQVVKEPMDLRTIEKKINFGRYEHVAEFHADINKIFLNSYKFNPKETNYYTLTIQLEDYYHELLKEVEINPGVLEAERTNKLLRSKVSGKSEQDFSQQTSNKKPKPTPQQFATKQPQIEQQGKQKPLEKIPSQKPKKSTQIDRKDLIKRVSKLPSKALQRVIQAAFGEVGDDKSTFALDFQKMSEETVSKIDSIVRSEMERTQSEKNYLAGMEKWMLLF